MVEAFYPGAFKSIFNVVPDEQSAWPKLIYSSFLSYSWLENILLSSETAPVHEAYIYPGYAGSVVAEVKCNI